MDEKEVYHGAHRNPPDERDYIYDKYVEKKAAAAGAVVIDWKKGYDIRNKLGGDIFFQNQMSSSSCVGQGAAYYVFVKQALEMIKKYGQPLSVLRTTHSDEVDRVSAKAIYAQIYLESLGGGAYIRDAFKVIKDWGSLFDKVVPSNRTDGSTDEGFMRDKSWLTADKTELAKKLQASAFYTISAANNMNLFAQAILENDGVVGGVEGENNGTWHTERPKPPIDESGNWGHCLYYGAFGEDEIGQFIATPNSWGNLLGTREWQPGDPPGFGWQKFYQNYFDNNGRFMFNPTTLVDKPNEETNNDETIMATNVRVVKDAKSPACGLWLPALSPEGLRSICANFGISVPKNADGSINWAKWIDGDIYWRTKAAGEGLDVKQFNWENAKRWAISSLVTFLTGFGLVFLNGIDNITLESFQSGALIGLLFVAGRAGVKAIIEAFIKWRMEDTNQ